RTVEVGGIDDHDQALIWIEENQLGRRNLSDDQRAAIALRVLRRLREAGIVTVQRGAVMLDGRRGLGPHLGFSSTYIAAGRSKSYLRFVFPCLDCLPSAGKCG